MMKKMRLFVTAVLAAICMCGLISGNVTAAESVTTVAGVPELREWYAKNGAKSAVLKDNLIIRNSVTLGANSTSWKKELDMDEYYIHIMSGGSLTIDNKDFLLTSEEKNMIVVEPGGKLYLRYGTIRGTEDETVITLKTGAVFQMSSNNFNLTGEHRFISTGESQGSGENNQPQLLSVDEESLSIACMEGASASSLSLPASVKVSYLTKEGKTEQTTLPVSWDFSSVNLKNSGVYKVKGTFAEETLKSHSLTNPGQVSASLLLAVMKKEDAGTLNVRMLTLDSSGNTVVRLEFPMLTSDVTALYLYSSTDGKNFRRESWTQSSTGGAVTQTENFLAKSAGKVDPPWQYLEYSRRSDGPFWLQLEIVGSALAGKSNIVECDSLEEREPGRMKVYGTGGSGKPGNGSSGETGNGSQTGGGAAAGTGLPGMPGGSGAYWNVSGGVGGTGGSGEYSGSGGVGSGSSGSSGSSGNSGSGNSGGGIGNGGSGSGGSADGAQPGDTLISDGGLAADGSVSGQSGLSGEDGQALPGGVGGGEAKDGAAGLPGGGIDGSGLPDGSPEDGVYGDGLFDGTDGTDPLGKEGTGNPGWKGVAAAAAAAALLLAAAVSVWKFRKRRKQREHD